MGAAVEGAGGAPFRVSTASTVSPSGSPRTVMPQGSRPKAVGSGSQTQAMYLAHVLRDAGVSPSAALLRARLLYAADLGLYQITRALPAERPTESDLRPLIRELQDAFLR